MFPVLQKRKGFHGLIKGAEAAGEKRNGIRLFEKGHLPVEKIFICYKTGIALKHGIRFLFEGQLNVNAERALGARSLVNGLHNAPPGPGDNHVP